MYVKPIIYRIFSIITLILSETALIIGAIFAFPLVNDLSNGLPFFIYIPIMILFTSLFLLGLFCNYIESSAMLTFADMIQHEDKFLLHKIDKKFYHLPFKLFRGYGTTVFTVVSTIYVIAYIVLVIVQSIRTSSFISLPLIPLLFAILTIVLTYITYYAKFKAIGDLYELHSTKNESDIFKARLKENNPNLMRGYCIFLYVMAIILVIAFIVTMFLTAGDLFEILDTTYAILSIIGLIILCGISIICMAINGCYFDNIGKMLEHHMIRFKMF